MIRLAIAGVRSGNSFFYSAFGTDGPGGSHLLFAFPWTIRWFGTPGLSGAGLLHALHGAGRILVPASASLIVLLSTRPSPARTTLREHQMNLSGRLAWGALALVTVTVAGLVGHQKEVIMVIYA